MAAGSRRQQQQDAGHQVPVLLQSAFSSFWESFSSVCSPHALRTLYSTIHALFLISKIALFVYLFINLFISAFLSLFDRYFQDLGVG